MKYFFIIFALIFFSRAEAESPSAKENRSGTPSAVENYLKLELLFTRYDGAMFGSRPYHEHALRDHLYDLLYKEIETAPDFVLISPEGFYEKGVHSRLRYRRWLDIRGAADPESAYEAAGKNYETMRSWWRSGPLVSVRGKVLKARITTNPYGRSVEIYLEKIKIIKHSNKG